LSSAAGELSTEYSQYSMTSKRGSVSKYEELSSKYATSEADAQWRKDFSLLRRLIRGALRHQPNPDEEDVPNSMVLDLCRKHPEWALQQFETEQEGVQLSPLFFLIHNRARLAVIQGFCQSFPQAAQEFHADPATRPFRLDGHPLHLACITRQEEGALIALLANQYPPAASIPNLSGMLPLQLLLEYRGWIPAADGIQALVHIHPEAVLASPPPLLSVLAAHNHHCTPEIQQIIWKHVPAHLTRLQLDNDMVPNVTLHIAKAIGHVLPQLLELEWTSETWAPEAWIYFAQKYKRLEGCRLKKLVLKPPVPISVCNVININFNTNINSNHDDTGIPWPRRHPTVPQPAAQVAPPAATALTPAHMHRAFVNLLQHVVTLEHLDIQGIEPGVARRGVHQLEHNHNNNPTWQLLANRGHNNNPQPASLSSSPPAHNNQCLHITEPIVHLLNHSRLRYLRIRGFPLQLPAILQALTTNTHLEQLIINDTIVEPPTHDGQLTLARVLEHHNVTLQKAELRMVVPRHANKRRDILLEYNKVKYYTLLNQYGRAAARDQTASLNAMIQLVVTAQLELVQLPLIRRPQADNDNNNNNNNNNNTNNNYRNRQLVVLGIVFGLLRESPGSWSQPERKRHPDPATAAIVATNPLPRDDSFAQCAQNVQPWIDQTQCTTTTILRQQQKPQSEPTQTRKRKDPPLSACYAATEEKRLAGNTGSSEEEQHSR
jgi:hypothetical protein